MKQELVQVKIKNEIVLKKFGVVSHQEEQELNDYGNKTFWHEKTVYKNKNTHSYLYEQTVKNEYLDDERLSKTENVYINELEQKFNVTNSYYVFKNGKKLGKVTKTASYKEKELRNLKSVVTDIMVFKNKNYCQRTETYENGTLKSELKWFDGEKIVFVIEENGECSIKIQKINLN